MASIEPYYDKSGQISSFRITVYDGKNFNGIRKRRRKTWRPKPGMTNRQANAAVQRIAHEFEKEIYDGFRADDTQTFAEYANYVLELKERNGIRARTIDRYRDMLGRINDNIGSMRLTEIRPQHLNEFYKYLSEVGVRSSKEKAIAKINLESLTARSGIPKDQLARSVGMAPTTFRDAVKGNQVSLKTAEKVSQALGIEVKNAFRISQDMRKLSNKTILEHHSLISTVLEQAVKEGLVPFNVAERAELPKATRKEVNYFQPEQVEAIRDAAETEPIKWKTLVHLFLVTGARRGEILGLKWANVDFDGNRIYICNNVLYTPDRGIYEDTPKTAKSIRYISLPKETMSLLREYRLSQLEQRFAMGDRWHNRDFVFTQENGEPMHPDSVTDWLTKFSKRHDLPHINAHAFRHTMASILYFNGVDSISISKRLGHAQPSTTTNIYAHIIEEADKKNADIIADVFLKKA